MGDSQLEALRQPESGPSTHCHPTTEFDHRMFRTSPAEGRSRSCQERMPVDRQGRRKQGIGGLRHRHMRHLGPATRRDLGCLNAPDLGKRGIPEKVSEACSNLL